MFVLSQRLACPGLAVRVGTPKYFHGVRACVRAGERAGGDDVCRASPTTDAFV